MERPLSEPTIRYFTTYSGVRLPFNLAAELTEAEINNRNTYFEGRYDAEGRLLSFRKMVYGEVELEHRYSYDGAGKLRSAEIVDEDGEVTAVEAG